MKRIKLFVALIFLLVSLCLFSAVAAAGEALAPKVKALGLEDAPKVLFVGNSFFFFNNSMHNHVVALVEATARKDPSMAKKLSKGSATLAAISGSRLHWHDLESYFRPNAIGDYRFDKNNNVVMLPPDEQLFNIVIMMDNSLGPIHPQQKDGFFKIVEKDVAIVRKQGAIPVLFMTWAYADKPEMTALLDAAYTKAGNDNDVIVVPAGLAFAKSLAERPDIILHHKDKRHPGLAGTYLGACVIYSVLFNQSPVGLEYTADMDASVSKHLQKVAWDTVQEYYRR